MPAAHRAVIDRVKRACFRIVVRPKAPPFALYDIAAAGDRRLLRLAARSIGTEAALSVVDDLAWELPRPQELTVFGARILAPPGHAPAPFVKLHRQHQMNEVSAGGIEDVTRNVSLVQPL